jgi:ABC-2 type transport system permease protein
MGIRLLSIIRKEFVQIRRDPRTIVLILIMPIIQLFLLGYAATSDVRNVPMAVFDQSQSHESRALLDAYRAADYFRIAYAVASADELRALIENGQARAGIIIPPDYAEQLQQGQAEVGFVLDGSDPTVATTALAAAQFVGQAHATEIMSERLAMSGQAAALQPPLDVRTRVWYNPDLVSAYFMIPGVIGMVLYAITAIVTATAVVRERERGTIEQLIVTPIRPMELMIGKVLPYVILAFVDTLIVIAIGHWWFRVPIQGSLTLLLAISGIFILSGLGIGLLASTIANSQQEAMLTVFVTLLPSIFLSGFFFPLQAMPRFLQLVSILIPLRYYLVVVRSILLKGVGLEAIRVDVIALCAFGIMMMTLAATRFRKRLD